LCSGARPWSGTLTLPAAHSPPSAPPASSTPRPKKTRPQMHENLPLSASEEEAVPPPRRRRNAPDGVDYSSDEVAVSSIGVIASVGDGGSVGVGADARSFGIGLWGPLRLRPSGRPPRDRTSPYYRVRASEQGSLTTPRMVSARIRLAVLLPSNKPRPCQRPSHRSRKKPPGEREGE
jgi:hypothetical protein